MKLVTFILVLLLVACEKRGIDFLGYRFYHSHILLRKSIAIRLKSKIKKLSEKAFLNFKDICSIASYKGWLMHANCYSFTQKYFTQLNGKAIG